jgi:hypothetical protein
LPASFSATFTHSSLQIDDIEVRNLIEADPEIRNKIASAYRVFVEAVADIVSKRTNWEALKEAIDGVVSEERKTELLQELAEPFDFNVSLRFSFLGYNFSENVQSVADIFKAVREGKIKLSNPRVIRESSPKITAYDSEIES